MSTSTYAADCDTCGARHEATYSHEGQFGQGAIFAVVCTRDWVTDYYTRDGVVAIVG